MAKSELDLLNAADVAELLKIQRSSVYNLMRYYGFPSGYKLGRSRRWRYSEIQEWINNNNNNREA